MSARKQFVSFSYRARCSPGTTTQRNFLTARRYTRLLRTAPATCRAGALILRAASPAVDQSGTHPSTAAWVRSRTPSFESTLLT
jgi:hypothetical protein